MLIQITDKACKTCGKTKPLSEFYHKTNPLRPYAECKVCFIARAKRNSNYQPNGRMIRKLTDKDVIAIRNQPGMTQAEMAQRFKVSQSTISKVVRGLSHKVKQNEINNKNTNSW